MNDNLHPVDELFALRREIAKLEKELRALVMEMAPTEMVGRNAEAAVTVTTRRTLDTKAVMEEMGEDWIAERSKVSEVTMLKVREL